MERRITLEGRKRWDQERKGMGRGDEEILGKKKGKQKEGKRKGKRAIAERRRGGKKGGREGERIYR